MAALTKGESEGKGCCCSGQRGVGAAVQQQVQKKRIVGFATCAGHSQLYFDDVKAIPALEKLGIEVRSVVWTEHLEKLQQGKPVEELDAIVIRSCWDYHLKREAFEQWLGLLGKLTSGPHAPKAFNPIRVAKWNLNKLYLRDLAAKGVLIPNTIWLPHCEGITFQSSFDKERTLEEFIRERGLNEVVVKPIVSLSAHETWRSSLAEAASHQERFRKLLHASDDDSRSLSGVMIQEYLPEITTKGELSFVFFRGAYAYTVQKLPKDGDFRVQSEWGGTKTVIQPEPALLAQATNILRTFGMAMIERNLIDIDTIDMSEMGFDDQTAAAVTAVLERLLYARVDAVATNDGRLLLMELELIDPELYFDKVPGASELFASALEHSLHNH